MPRLPDVLCTCELCARDEFNYDLVYAMPCCGASICIDYCLKGKDYCPKCLTPLTKEFMNEYQTQ